MNKEIMIKCGFEKEVNLIEQGFCPFCETKIDKNSFKDVLSLKEYYISGLCQTCQDQFFNK
jgi:hypothetical protein